MVSDTTQVPERRGEATRRDIINVARRLFSEHGYHNSGIADIQAVTGLTKGAFYYHFRNKQALALAVLERAEADYAEHLFSPAETIESPGERIAVLLDNVVALNCEPQWCNCQMMATLGAELTVADGRLRDAVLKIQTETFAFWRDLIAAAQEAGEANDRIEPAVWAQLILSSLAGMLTARKLGHLPVEPRQLVAAIKTLLLEDVRQSIREDARNAQENP